MNCLIVADHILLADLLSRVLHLSNVIGSVHTVPNVKQALRLIDRDPPDILILDLGIHDTNTQEVGLHLTKIQKFPAIILLTSNPHNNVCEADLLPHIYAVITRESSYVELAIAISNITKQHQLNGNIEPKLGGLMIMSPREQEVFVLIGKGRKSKEISAALNIAKSTVESHRKSIAQRLGTSGGDLVRIAAVYCYKSEQGILASEGSSPAQIETKDSTADVVPKN